MKTALLVNTQEDLVRDYFAAFVSRDITRMMTDIHPAIHYIRSINGKLETVINGADNFREFMQYYVLQLNESTLELTRVKMEEDFIEMRFSIHTQPAPQETMHRFTGRLVFWFMDKKIFQIVAQIEVT